MKTGKAFVAGVVGGLVITLIGVVARAIGMKINVEMMLGTMFGGPSSTGKWVLGLVLHLILSGLIALAYAAGFEYVAHRAGAAVGTVFSLVHIILAGVVLGMIPAIHPLIPEKMAAPGAFMAAMGGAYVATFVIEHLIYGAIVGWMYGPVATVRGHEARARAQVT